jgi:hypothetical protein
MTLTDAYSLQDAIEDALGKTGNGSTREVITYLQLHHRKTLDANSLTIESVGLGSLVRQFRKKPPNKDFYIEVKNLCLDFGLGPLDLDDEISVPLDLGNVLNCECDWPQLEDATIEQLDKHLILREAQQRAHEAKTQAYRSLRQAAIAVALSHFDGRCDVPLRDLRVIARENNSRDPE